MFYRTYGRVPTESFRGRLTALRSRTLRFAARHQPSKPFGATVGVHFPAAAHLAAAPSERGSFEAGRSSHRCQAVMSKQRVSVFETLFETPNILAFRRFQRRFRHGNIVSNAGQHRLRQVWVWSGDVAADTACRAPAHSLRSGKQGTGLCKVEIWAKKETS